MMGGFFSRTLKGAAVGGVVGGLSSDGSMKGILGGAGAGMIAGGFGNKIAGANYAGFARKGVQMARRGTVGLERAGWRGFDKWGGSMAGNAMGRTALAANSARGSLGTARSYLGTNAAQINKYGGRTMAYAGMVSAGLIGSSVINSNYGY